MSQKVNFTCNLNDGGKGHSATFTLAELGIDENDQPSMIEDAINEAYGIWMEGFNMGGWGYED